MGYSPWGHKRVGLDSATKQQSLLQVFMASWASLVAPDGKESACSAGNLGSIPGLGQSPQRGQGMAAHSSNLAWRISLDRGAWRATVHGVAKSQTRLSD